jgi:class 3 adenylate cyclase
MIASRRLAAILAADAAGYSRLMGADEEGTLERLKALRRELVDPKIAEHPGHIVKTTGDGMLVEFASVVDATVRRSAAQPAISHLLDPCRLRLYPRARTERAEVIQPRAERVQRRNDFAFAACRAAAVGHPQRVGPGT